ncbi:hypothetical protein [Sediminitomix flava]|uniref:Lipoprotein n=1 Tax=Sediminitomix flava TaxID=379075 RepID=A0A315YZ67_SEDFL|nr:hypothetical protein [Sediminitomix flava]PWJ34198.1 hypothetical protein BC781_111108 [Sediminitomix flava]
MKSFFHTIVTVLALSFGLFACEEATDEGDELPANYFKVGDDTYELSQGMLENYGTDDWHEGYNLDLSLVSKGIKISSDGDSEPTGSGEFIYFELFSDSEDRLSEGTYPFEFNDELQPSMTFDYALYATNWSPALEDIEDAEGSLLVNGALTVTQNGETYELSFNGINLEGKKVEGKYTGALTYLDYTDTSAFARKSAKQKRKLMTVQLK